MGGVGSGRKALGRQVERGILSLAAYNIPTSLPTKERNRRVCNHCGTGFDGDQQGIISSRRVAYCSDICQSDHRKHLKREIALQGERKAKWAREIRNCKECEACFQPTSPNQIYCSKDCCRKATPPLDRDRWVIFNRDNFRCYYCGAKSYANNAELHCDHIFPKSKGGKDTAGNLVTACTKCNLAKHVTIPNVLAELRREVARRNAAAGICDKAIIKHVSENAQWKKC